MLEAYTRTVITQILYLLTAAESLSLSWVFWFSSWWNRTPFTRTWLRYFRVFAISNPFVVCLSSVTFVRPTQAVETFGNISAPFCVLAILWPPCKILRRLSQGNPYVGAGKRERGSKIERCHVRVSHLQMSFSCNYLVPFVFIPASLLSLLVSHFPLSKC